MSAPASRRGFLRGLAALPLIGGGVTLIGSPTAVAEPATDLLLITYADWLAQESVAVLKELEARPLGAKDADAIHWRRRWSGAVFQTNPLPLATPLLNLPSPPSTRAALVLSAVGCDWRRA